MASFVPLGCSRGGFLALSRLADAGRGFDEVLLDVLGRDCVWTLSDAGAGMGSGPVET